MHTYAFADAFNMCTKPDRHVSIFPNLIYKSSSNLCCTLYVHRFHFLHSYFRLKKGCYVILRLFCRYYLQDIPFEQPIKTVLKMVYLEVTSFIYLCNLENVTNNTRKKGSQLKKRKGPSCYFNTLTLSCKRPKTDLKIIQKRPINKRKCQKSKYTLS